MRAATRVAVIDDDLAAARHLTASADSAGVTIAPEDERWLQNRLQRLKDDTAVRFWVATGRGPIIKLRVGDSDDMKRARAAIKAVIRLEATHYGSY